MNSNILKRVISIFLIAFYTLGTLCLPNGDFAMLKDLPEMYRHCKATEDKDLDVFEFVTEHLSPIGQLLEHAEHEMEDDGDKPHEPIQSSNSSQTIVFTHTIPVFSISAAPCYPVDVKHAIITQHFFASNYISKIFRPPIFA